MSDLFEVEPSFSSPLEQARKQLEAALLAYDQEKDTDKLGQLLDRVQRITKIVRAMEAARLA